MIKKWIAGMMILILVLTGCASDPDDNNEEIIIPRSSADEYAVMQSFLPSPVRNYHGTYLGRYDMFEIGDRLLDKSKQYFSVNDYILQEGQILTQSLLTTLVRREADSNPQGLNPPLGSEFDTGSSSVTLSDAVIVADVVELNFLRRDGNQYRLGGISLAIVMNQSHRVVINGIERTVTISTDRLYQFGSDIGRKLESYLRTLPNVTDVPIYITLYSTLSSDSYLPGGMIGEGYFESRTGQFKTNDERWVMFPSTEATNLDIQTSAGFDALKKSLQDVLPESIGVVGKGRYIEGNLDKLDITLHMSVKTYAEVVSVTQKTVSLLDTFEKRDMLVVVSIRSLQDVVVVITRDRGQTTPTVIYLF